MNPSAKRGLQLLHRFRVQFAIAMTFAMTILWLANIGSAGEVAGRRQDDDLRRRNDDSRRPNIVLIYTDDQGYGDLSATNADAKFETPNLDRLAREGLVFSNAHSADSVCTPSRYGLMTGRYPWRTRLKRGVLGAEAECLIDASRLTMTEMLRSVGYRTGMFGKWHLGMDFPGTWNDRDWSVPATDTPIDHGFDRYFGIPASMNFGVLGWFDGRVPLSAPTLFTRKKNNPRSIDYRIRPPYQTTPQNDRDLEVAEDFLDADCLTRFTDEAIRWLREGERSDSQSTPFFLYLPLTSPHYPICPRPAFHGQGAAGAYGEFMVETDHHVGRILEVLEQIDASENTLIVFTSDNGPERSWIGRLKEFGHDSRGGLRGGKRSVYEGGHRVPFLLRWPRGIQDPGRVCDRLTGQVDLMATVASLIGFAMPTDAAEDSVSFAEVLRDGDAGPRTEPLIVHGNGGGQSRYAVIDGDHKLIAAKDRVAIELYDLSDDLAETQNVADRHPQRVDSMLAELTTIVCRGRTTAGPAQPNDTGYWKDLVWIDESEFETAVGSALAGSSP